jgi:hypothetical protein
MKGILQAGQHVHYQSHTSKLKVEEPLLAKPSSTIVTLSIKVNGFSASFIYQAQRSWQADIRLKVIPQPTSVKRSFKLSSPSIQTQDIFLHKTSTLLYRDAVMQASALLRLPSYEGI